MLVLSRKTSETIVMTVGQETIVVMLTALRGDKARIGIAASSEVKIIRGEVLEREEQLAVSAGHCLPEKASEKLAKLEVANV